MFLDPNTLADNPERLEDIEKGSTRFVAQAIELFRAEAIDIFTHESDLQADIGEDITAEALDSLGMSRSAQRVFGKMDYKRARYIFEPEYAVRQVLLVDSKAKKRPTSMRGSRPLRRRCGSGRYGRGGRWIFRARCREWLC